MQTDHELGLPVPQPDPISAEFWQHCADRSLHIQRCANCRHWQHPPQAICPTCLSTELRFEPVSGEGKVYSYTLTVSGMRHPAFAAGGPYLVGLVELAEQPGLHLYTNFPGATLDDMKVGAPVAVEFEDRGQGVVLPQFHLVAGGKA